MASFHTGYEPVFVPAPSSVSRVNLVLLKHFLLNYSSVSLFELLDISFSFTSQSFAIALFFLSVSLFFFSVSLPSPFPLFLHRTLSVSFSYLFTSQKTLFFSSTVSSFFQGSSFLFPFILFRFIHFFAFSFVVSFLFLLHWVCCKSCFAHRHFILFFFVFTQIPTFRQWGVCTFFVHLDSRFSFHRFHFLREFAVDLLSLFSHRSS
jgi:hypothetical protein